MNFKVVQWPFVFLRNTPDHPFLNQNHWIALNARFSLTADPQLTPPPLRMRPQTPPFLLKKNENCRKIIKAPLHGHETFGAIHTIQHHCIKHCSRCRRRGYYNGLNREAPPERGTFFRLQVHEREGVFIVEVYERDQNEISHRCILWMWETRKPVLAIYSYCKDGVFTAVKKGCSVQN